MSQCYPARIRTHFASNISLEDLDQEKERIAKLDRQGRITVLEKLISDMEKNSTVTSTAETHPSGSPKEQDLSVKRNGTMAPADEEAATADPPAQDTLNEHPLRESPRPVLNEELKDNAARLELYRALLASAKTESTPDPATTSSPIKKHDLAIEGPQNQSPVETAAASPSLQTLASGAGQLETSALQTGEQNGEVSTPVMNGVAPAVAEAQIASHAAIPQTSSIQQDGVKEQDNEKEEVPIVVKAEPVEMDFSTVATEAAPTMPEQQTGETRHTFPEVATTHPHQHQNHPHPGEVSMDEDPLLAELFPTFPTGDSPGQTHSMQTEEEADPLLAGMLQEVRLSKYLASRAKRLISCGLAGCTQWTCQYRLRW